MAIGTFDFEYFLIILDQHITLAFTPQANSASSFMNLCLVIWNHQGADVPLMEFSTFIFIKLIDHPDPLRLFAVISYPSVPVRLMNSNYNHSLIAYLPTYSLIPFPDLVDSVACGRDNHR